MCAKPGKILSSPKLIRIIHSASTLSVESRKHYKYVLKLAIRRSVGDMVEILEGGNTEIVEFLKAEMARLPGVTLGEPPDAPQEAVKSPDGQPEMSEAEREFDSSMWQ